MQSGKLCGVPRLVIRLLPLQAGMELCIPLPVCFVGFNRFSTEAACTDPSSLHVTVLSLAVS